MAADRYQYDMENASVYRNAMGRYKTDAQLAFIREALPAAPATVLDIGGGGGRIAIPLAGDGHAVTVLDPSAEALELLRERTGGRIRTVHGDAMTHEPEEPFDAALVIDTVKYLTSVPLDAFFAQVGRYVREGGVVVIAEINRASWRNRLSHVLGRRSGGLRYNIDSPDGYRRALEASGFEVQAMSGFLWMPFPFNSDSRLVPAFAGIERRLGLARWVAQSPWLLIAARRLGGDRRL